MSLTLASADQLTHDLIFAGIVEETVEEDPLLSLLPFETVTGFKQVAYNRENNLGAESQYIGIDDTIDESTPTWTQVTETLKILADRMEIDRFLAETKNAVQNIEAAALAGKGKQMMRKFHDKFYYGDQTSNAHEINGLHSSTILSSGQTIENGSSATGAAGTLTELTQLVTTVKPGRPDVLFCNRNMLRRFSSPYISNVQYNVNKDTIGDLLSDFAGIPLAITDYITMTEAISGGSFSTRTGGATTTMFAVKFGRGSRVVPGTNGVFNVDGVLGIQAGPMNVGMPQELVNKLGHSRKLWWYHDVIIGSTLSIAAYTGLTDAALTI